MEKAISYDPDTIIRFKLNTNKRVAIQSSNNLAPVLDIGFPVTEPIARKMGRWIIECRGKNVYLRETSTVGRDDCIILSFQEEKINSDISYVSSGRRKNEPLKQVKRLDVYPREVAKIKIMIDDAASAANHEENQNSESAAENNIETGAAISSTIEGATENTTQNTAVASDRSSAAQSARIRELETALERERNTVGQLQQILDMRLDSMVEGSERSNQALSDNNKIKLSVLKTLRDEEARLGREQSETEADVTEMNSKIDLIKEEISEKRYETERLQAQLKEMTTQREFIDLDCEAAEKQLNELRTQVDLDMDTLSLLEDDCILKHGSISNTLIEVKKEIENAEKRIALILKFRLKFNGVVEEAILNGDGTIMSSDESGRLEDGNREAAPPENS